MNNVEKICLFYISIILISCSNTINIRSSETAESKYSVKKSLIIEDNYKIYTISIFDTLKYCRVFDVNNILLNDYYLIKDLKFGPESFYNKGKVTRKINYKNNQPIFIEDYYYNQMSGNIDSLKGSYIRDKVNGRYFATPVGKIIYHNGKIDMLNSNYYTIDLIKPIIKSIDSKVVFKMCFIGRMDKSRVIFGELDTSNYNLLTEVDNVYSNKLFLEIEQKEKRFKGFMIIEGNIWFCKIKNEQEEECYNRIPFYYPVYFMEDDLYEYFFGDDNTYNVYA